MTRRIMTSRHRQIVSIDNPAHHGRSLPRFTCIHANLAISVPASPGPGPKTPPLHLSSSVLAYLFLSFTLVFTLGSPNLNSDFTWRGSVPGAQLLPRIRGCSQSGAGDTPPPHLSSCIASDLTLNLQRACISFLVIHFGVHIRLFEFEL